MWLSGVAPLLLRLYTDGLGLRRTVKYYGSEFPWKSALEPWAVTGPTFCTTVSERVYIT